MRKQNGNQRSLPKQQGDVLIRPMPLPSVRTRRADTVVARGEATGHCHEVIGEGVEVYEDGQGTLYISAPVGGTLTHQEHKPITLEPGTYQIGIVKEYDHFAEEARQVRD